MTYKHEKRLREIDRQWFRHNVRGLVRAFGALLGATLLLYIFTQGLLRLAGQ